MEDWKGGVASWDKTSDLGHYGHEGERADISAFPTHVATGDDLKSRLLTGICIVGNISLAVDLLSNRVSPAFHSKGFGDFWPTIILCGSQLGK